MYNWIAAEQTADEDSVVITDHDLGCQDEEEEGRETRAITTQESNQSTNLVRMVDFKDLFMVR